MSLEPSFDTEGNPLFQYHNISALTLKSGRTCQNLRLGFCVFAEKPDLPVVILHPALTGSPKAWTNSRPTQGDGWFSRHIGMGKLLDPTMHCILCVDPLGGNGVSSGAEELSNFAADLSFADGIEACALFLKEKGICEVQAVIGGSIGGGQAFEWLFQNYIKVNKIFDISGSACRTSTASEFFLIQAELLDFEKLGDTDLLARLSKNTSDLLGVTLAFDLIFERIKENLKELLGNYSLDFALKVARQIGFLRFVTPNFYENKFNVYIEELGSIAAAKEKILSWIDYQGESFLSRFSAKALRQLCYMDAYSTRRNAELVAEAIAVKKIHFVGFSVSGDLLFPHSVQERFYNQVKNCLHLQSKTLVHFISEKDEVNGHDHFLSEAFLESAKLLRPLLI
jgi:homoserine acetyltransferase